MRDPRTKVIFALGLIDIARQVATAWSSKQQQERVGLGAGFRQDAVRVAHDVREHLPQRLEWGVPPWRRTPTLGERVAAWWPVAAIVVAAAAGVVATARWITRGEPDADAEQLTSDSRMVGAVRASSRAIDAGVDRVLDGGTAIAAGTASASAAAGTAIRTATVRRAKLELDSRVVRPAKRRVVVYGTLGVLGLTAYVTLVAIVVQLAVAALA